MLLSDSNCLYLLIFMLLLCYDWMVPILPRRDGAFVCSHMCCKNNLPFYFSIICYRPPTLAFGNVGMLFTPPTKNVAYMWHTELMTRHAKAPVGPFQSILWCIMQQWVLCNRHLKAKKTKTIWVYFSYM